MIRVHVICEGQTEEMFVKELIYPQLLSHSIDIRPSLIGKPGQKGGDVSFERLHVDIKKRIKEDRTSYCTTFFDFYGLPMDFPGKVEAAKCRSIEDKSDSICAALKEKLEPILGNAMRRFIPFVQMYEFEGLLFSDAEKFAEGINERGLTAKFQDIRDQFTSPEEINDSKETAPSKRIKKIYPGYEKPLYGSMAALEIGLKTIRRECGLFDSWLCQMERLA